MSLETLARDVLAADPTVVGLVKVGDAMRLYPLVLPQKPDYAPYPALTYRGVSRTSDFHMEGPGLTRVRLQVDSWALTYVEAKALARAARMALLAADGTFGDGSGLQMAEVVNETDLFEEIPTPSGAQRLFRISTDFFVWAQDQAA